MQCAENRSNSYKAPIARSTFRAISETASGQLKYRSLRALQFWTSTFSSGHLTRVKLLGRLIVLLILTDHKLSQLLIIRSAFT